MQKFVVQNRYLDTYLCIISILFILNRSIAIKFDFTEQLNLYADFFIKNIFHNVNHNFVDSVFWLNPEFLEAIAFLKLYVNVWFFPKKTVSTLVKSLL